MTPECDEMDIILYIENELPESHMQRMESHFARCPSCRRLLDRHRVIRIAMAHASAAPVPEDFPARVMARIPTPFEKLLSSARERVLAFAAVIVLGVVGLVVSQVGSPADALSADWWNGFIAKNVRGLMDGFLALTMLIRVLVDIGVFIVGGAVFVLHTLGKALVYSPQGQTLGLCSLALFGGFSALLLRRAHAPRRVSARAKHP